MDTNLCRYAEYCAVFVQADIDVRLMLTRRLSTCRHIPVRRTPPLWNRAYYNNPSFSARPDKSLVAKIWYRKDGVPRSKWKGAFYGDYPISFNNK